MKPSLSLLLLLLFFNHLSAQELTITASGTVSNVQRNVLTVIDSSVQVGVPFTETFTFEPDGSTYQWTGGTSTVSVGDYTLVSDNSIGAQSAEASFYTDGDGPFGLSGYVLTSTLLAPTGSDQANLILETTNPSVTSVITSTNILQLPLEDFNYNTEEELNILQGNGSYISGSLSSYSVSISSVPEPSTLSLLALLSLSLLLSKRMVCVASAAVRYRD